MVRTGRVGGMGKTSLQTLGGLEGCLTLRHGENWEGWRDVLPSPNPPSSHHVLPSPRPWEGWRDG